MSAAANAVLHRCRKEWLAAGIAKSGDVLAASLTKSTLPNGYWEAEYKARMRLRVAEIVAEELTDLP